jgi:PPOX class probable FMN-dependent enzyme
MPHWFDGALTGVDGAAELDALYDPPSGLAARKQTTGIDEVTAAYIAACPMVFVSSSDAGGRCDVTPRGGQPGFATVLDDRFLAIPDATGNRRIDTYRNVVATGQAGLLFVIPGRGQTLRINGPAAVSSDPALLGRLQSVGKPPKVALVVEAVEVFAHCPKAFIRAKLWDPTGWPDAADQPSPAELTRAHIADPEVTVSVIERSNRESLQYRFE